MIASGRLLIASTRIAAMVACFLAPSLGDCWSHHLLPFEEFQEATLSAVQLILRTYGLLCLTKRILLGKPV